jgi:undecaprenyl-diphosphatase
MDPPSGWRALDNDLFHEIYELDMPTVIAELVTHSATRGGAWLLLGLGFLLFGRGCTRRTGAALVTGLAAHVLVIEGLVKHAVARRRPFSALGLTLRDTFVDPLSYSFPSGHSAASFLGAWVLGARFPRWRLPLLGLAVLVAMSRVHLGAHYPTDVGAGALFGLFLGIVLVRVFRISGDAGDERHDSHESRGDRMQRTES